jgi:hypothetical protein
MRKNTHRFSAIMRTRKTFKTSFVSGISALDSTPLPNVHLLHQRQNTNQKPESMKSTNFYSVLSLALTAFGVNANVNNTITSPRASSEQAKDIRYQVSVHCPCDGHVSNIHFVELLDAFGNFVAPIQVYRPGVKVYEFSETGSVRRGVRIARMVLSPYADHFDCPASLTCQPVVKVGAFLNGITYTFDLYPDTTPAKQ